MKHGLRWLSLIVLAVVLSACGTSVDGPPPKKTLTESDYLLEVSGNLLEGEFDPGAKVYVLYYSAINEDRSTSAEWYEDHFEVAADGAYEVTIDARKLGSETIAPGRFGEWLLVPMSDESSEVEVADSEAKLRVIRSVRLYQEDPASELLNFTHNLIHSVEQDYRDSVISMAGDLVFSDEAVTINGSAGVAGATPRLLLDLKLLPGWNFVYFDINTGGPPAYMAQPVGTQDISPWGLVAQLALESTTEPTDEGGYSMFTAHEVNDAAPVESLWTGRLDEGSDDQLTGPSWFSSTASSSPLIPLTEVFGISVSSGSISSSESEARGLIAVTLYYDETTMAAGAWWSNPQAASGSLIAQSAAGNAVAMIYVDRSTELTLNDVVFADDPATTYRASGVQLDFGWNWVEVQPDPDAGVIELAAYTEVPEWVMVAD